MLRNQDALPWRHRPFPELVRLAWPIALSMLSYSFMTLIDTLFVGRLGASALAGVALGGVVCFTLLCFGFGLLRSIKLLVSQAVGAGRQHRIVGFIGAGLILAAGFGVVNIALGQLIGPQLGRLLETPEGATSAADYVSVRVFGAPFFLAAVALRQARYGLGDSRGPLVATLCANVTNVVLDYLLIFEFDAGVAGAAWASVIAHVVDVVLLAITQAREGFGLDRRALASMPLVATEGLPLGTQFLLEVGAFLALTALFASLGERAVGAHQIVLQVSHLSFLPALALGDAAAVLAGQAVGADRDELVVPVARRAAWVAAIYTGACGVVFALFGAEIARGFTDDAHLIDTVEDVFLVAAVFQVADGLAIVARCVLRGAGDVQVPAAISVVLAWLIPLPVAYWLGLQLGLGVVGGWIGISIDIGVIAVIMWWRLERGVWRRHARAARERMDREAVTSVRQPANT